MADTRGRAVDTPAAGKVLSPAARRSLAEAAERRKARESSTTDAKQPEHGGRHGPDPARYGDWEVKGIASDF
jgi:hypothetical protein